MESELREGYKMTELGALPEEWEVVKLGDEKCIQKMKAGGTPLSSEKKYYDNGTVPFVKIEDITKSKKYLFKTTIKITNEGMDECSAWLVPKNSIVYSMYASFGDAAINKIAVATNQAIISIIPQKESTDIDYLYYTLWNLKSTLNRYLRETTQKNLNAGVVKNLKIPLPPLPEQRRIATILSTLDETVEHTEALIEKYKNIKAGLMADLLTRGIDEEGRIRSEGTHRFKDSALGWVPEEWEFGGFEDMVDKSNKNAIKPGPFGSSLKKEFYVDDGYRVYGQEQVIAGTLSIGDYYVNKHKFEELKSFRIDIDDVLISLVGTTGKVLVVPSKFESGIINPRLLKITPDKRKSNSKFISYLLISGIITNQLATLSHGGTMDVLNGTTIRKLRFGIPSLKEQRRIAEILTAADQRIEKEEAYRDKLLQLKKGLMQDLLTGKVRVKDSSVQMVEQSEN